MSGKCGRDEEYFGVPYRHSKEGGRGELEVDETGTTAAVGKRCSGKS